MIELEVFLPQYFWSNFLNLTLTTTFLWQFSFSLLDTCTLNSLHNFIDREIAWYFFQIQYLDSLVWIPVSNLFETASWKVFFDGCESFERNLIFSFFSTRNEKLTERRSSGRWYDAAKTRIRFTSDKAAFANNIFPRSCFAEIATAPRTRTGTQFANSILDLSSWTHDIRAFLKTCLPPWKRNQIDRPRKRSHTLANRSHLFSENLSSNSIRNEDRCETRDIEERDKPRDNEASNVRWMYLSKERKFYNFTILLVFIKDRYPPNWKRWQQSYRIYTQKKSLF